MLPLISVYVNCGIQAQYLTGPSVVQVFLEWMNDRLTSAVSRVHCSPPLSVPTGKHSTWPCHCPVLPQIHQPPKVGKITRSGPLLLQTLSSYEGAFYSHGHQRALLKAQDSLEQLHKSFTCVAKQVLLLVSYCIWGVLSILRLLEKELVMWCL